MWHRNNFKVYKTNHKGTLSVSSDDGIPANGEGDFIIEEDVSYLLADNSKKFIRTFDWTTSTGPPEWGVNGGSVQPHQNNDDGDEYGYIQFRLTFEYAENISCFYIEGLNLLQSTVEVLAGDSTVDTYPVNPSVDDLSGRVVASAEQVDDVLFCPLPTSISHKIYEFRIHFRFDKNNSAFDFESGGPGLRLTMSAPFFGGEEMGNDVEGCYSWGRKYDFSPNHDFVETDSQSYSSAQTFFKQKQLVLEYLSSKELFNFANFINADRNGLRLLTYNEENSKHHFVLGKTYATAESTQREGDFNTVNLTSKAKYAS